MSPRNRQSAKKAGATFERQVADYLAQHIDDRIDRRAKTGSKDRGDIAGVRIWGQRLVLECKNTTRLNLAGWMNQAEIERGNDDALAGLIIHKRHGNNQPGDQWVTTTLRELTALFNGYREEEEEEHE